MLSFTCDYTQGAHPAILERLFATNFQQEPGYGEDVFTASAREKIRTACACPEAAVYLLVGGTQTNSTIIASLLHDVEGAVAVRPATSPCMKPEPWNTPATKCSPCRRTRERWTLPN